MKIKKLLSDVAVRRIKLILKIQLLILRIICYIVVGSLMTYAIAFSIAGTFVLYKGYQYVRKPVEEVRYFKKHNPQKTAFMRQYIRELEADSTLPDTLIHRFIPLDSICPNLVSSVLAVEDDAFYLHPGIDIASILSATEYNRTVGKNRHGASTITQQMAKNLFLSPDRTFERKVRELGYALLMERFLGKKRILELYMNYAQWGKNIFGCEAAAQHYFKKSAAKLSRREAALMAAVLAKPTKLTPYHTRSIFMGKRLAVIAQNLYLHRNLHRTINDSGYLAITGTLPPDSAAKDSSRTDSLTTKPDSTAKPTVEAASKKVKAKKKLKPIEHQLF